MIRYSELFDLAPDPKEALARTKQEVLAAVRVLANPALSAECDPVKAPQRGIS